MSDLYWSVKKYCKKTGLGKTTAYKQIKAGQIKSKLVHGRRLICTESARSLII